MVFLSSCHPHPSSLVPSPFLLTLPVYPKAAPLALVFWVGRAEGITFVPPEGSLQLSLRGVLARGRFRSRDPGALPAHLVASRQLKAGSGHPASTLGLGGPPWLGCYEETCGWWPRLGSARMSWELLQQGSPLGLAERGAGR